ncbi:MAG: IPT/TIG domain-containing protein [Candidatus Dormibacteria bacterium]
MTGALLRRLAAVSCGVAVATGAMGTARPVVVWASSLVCSVPHVDLVSPTVGRPGDRITVSGSFGSTANAACEPSLSVGGTPVGLTSHSNGALTFTAPPVNGPVVATLTDLAGAANSSNANLVYGTIPTVSGFSPGTPVEGQTISVSGGGFSFRTAGGALNPAVAATAFLGGSPCQALGVRSLTDSDLTLDGPGRYCNGAVQLAFQLVVDRSTNAVQPVVVGAGSINVAASVASVAPGNGAPGTRITVSGSGFGTGGRAAVGGSPAPVSWQDRSVAVTVPAAGVSGPIGLVRAYDGAAFDAGSVTVDAQITAVTPAAAGVGESVTISGAGFGPSPGSVRLGSADLPVAQWSPTSIRVTIPGGVVSGGLTVLPAVNTSATAALTIVPRLTAVSPTHGPAGTPLVVSGTSLGSRTGSVTVGGQPALVTLWADQRVAFTVPEGVRAGRSTIVATPPGGAAAGLPFTVDPGALTPAAAAAALAAAGITPPPIPPSPSGPVVTNGGAVDFHPQRKPPSPINLTLVPERDQADPGSDVGLTGTLVAYGKPVPGATVELVIVVEPGRDAALSPARAVTDSRGQVHGRLHLSGTAGDHILLARSGLYSDEIRVRGGSDTALATTGSVVKRSVFWGVMAALLLFVLGLGINLATTPGAALAGAGVWRQRPPGPRGVVIGGGRVAVIVFRSGVAGWQSSGRRLLPRLRRLTEPAQPAAARVRRLMRRSHAPPLPPTQ